MRRPEGIHFDGEEQRGEGCNQAVDGEQLDFGRFDIDPHDAGHILVIADEHERLTEFMSVENEPEEHGKAQCPECLGGYDAKNAARKNCVNDISLYLFDIPGKPARQENR